MDHPCPVAIIANSYPPYRSALHHRIVREIPQIKLYSLFTHERGDVAHTFHTEAEIGPVNFGSGESFRSQMQLRTVAHEWRKGGKIIRWLDEQRVRVVVMAGYNDVGRLRIMRWCHDKKVPCLLLADSNIRGDHVSGARLWLKQRLLNRVLHWCKGILVCGRLGKEYFLKYGADPKSIYISPYEPDYSMIRNLSEETLQHTRQRFGLTGNWRRIVFSGRLISVKRVDLIIDAFHAIAEQRPEWDLLIVGDGVLRKELESRVSERLRSRVQWTGFLDDQPAISAIYRLSDVLALTSDIEPWAVVVNEAVCAGMAIVASDVVGAAAELVRDGVNGRVFPPGDLDRLTQSLLDVTDPARIDAMKAASAVVLDDWQRRGDPIEGLRQALKDVGAI